MAARQDGYLPLRDYALLGDCHGAALVGLDGAVDWFCPARFDAQPACWALLDAEQGARFCIAPTEAKSSTRAYLPGTNILCTTFAHAKGTLTITDFLPVRSAKDADEPSVDLEAPGWLIRVVDATEGDCDLKVHYHPGTCEFDPSIDRTPDMRLYRPNTAPAAELDSTVRLKAGERQVFVLAPTQDAEQDPAAQAETLLETTEAFWKNWSQASRYTGPYRQAVERSALALKALTYAPTGAIVAAPTTSLPENIGGERNWDYRYSWLRDSSFVLQALGGLGYDDEAGRYCEYLGSTCVKELSILYGISSESVIAERELDHLHGYAGSQPVRVGNAASDQLQLDIYGEVADWALAYRALGGPIDDNLRAMLEEVADQAAELWKEPDQGIWEMRGDPRHYVHGKAMAWVALDRAIQLLGARDTWCKAREEILQELRDHAHDGTEGGFRQTLSDGGMDAALLLLPMVDLPLPDTVFDQTVRGVERELREGDFVLRYRLENTDDGLKGGEGAFLICSFWLVDALLCMDREKDARMLFERLLEHANDVGLYAEEIDPKTEAFLGNFPQAFTHLALINSAINLDLYKSYGPEALRGTHADRVERATSQARS
ncbi:glycoside hydrolase family 15 protein [Sulfitobacter delicatus]|uniref:Glucoamylase (Glucan-1,4-alpha-glucosidase), GH15 family n=1 Tax=Sulfitobacter delicatus TaxID=218672 RepID=A0A1G7NXC0_9RHOB|nr:glycoside hydrolase family 15 protein [Sulfitobacter delicatus]SDF78654.1 Glucoamylase (glucan-1,4-alpha-glucosidase), GH15 family [Sulfitobacter delicatus]